ncbi:hypothetical protein HYW55_02260 [Candidatus Gottesmanbacteria bacterium]|nr:hypothetical protein [Candidatus Gottesmanbacteria bacterium]
MIILIHGDDHVSSRNKLIEEKNARKSDDIKTFEGSKVTAKDLTEETFSQSLFSLPQTIIIENLTNLPKSKSKEECINILLSVGETRTIIFWEKSEVSKATINKYFSHTKVYGYTYPKLLFAFLDSIGKVRQNDLLQTFHRLLTQSDAELVYAMLIRQWRYLILARDLGLSGLHSLSPWQARKFMDQSHQFSLDDLQKSYRQLLAIDASVKSGQTPFTTSQLLDIFLVNL